MLKGPAVLGLCQFLYMSVIAVGIAFNALVGKTLAPSPALATLPFFFMMGGTALLTLLMPKFLNFFGYRKVFAIGALSGAFGGGTAILALKVQSFAIFCVAGLLIGVYQASSLYYRFAAADSVDGPRKSGAIAWVLSGGVIAALAGPMLGTYGLHLFSLEYSGSYLIAGILALIALPIIIMGPIVDRQQSNNGAVRLEKIPPSAYAAVLFCSGGYAMMLLVMLATPLAMSGCGFHAHESASVIQWHLLGMFAPSFLTGRLIGYVGAFKTAALGILILAIGCGVGLLGKELSTFHLSLLVVGVGWNFMYMGGSTILTQIPEFNLRSKLQSINEFVTFLVITFISGITGWLYDSFGWQIVLNIAIVFLIGVGVAVAVILPRSNTFLNAAKE